MERGQSQLIGFDGCFSGASGEALRNTQGFWFLTKPELHSIELVSTGS